MKSFQPESSHPVTLSREAAADAVGNYLECWLDSRPLPSNLRAAVGYALEGGKRVRPLLALYSCSAVGGEPAAAMAAAAAIEMIHSFSLVHDDLPAMDDDDLRRGRPTLHVHTGEAMAVLAGDALMGMAFELLAAEVRPPDRAGILCGELARATDDMIAGQVYDTLPETGEAMASMERLERIHRHKTGALIRCACRMGAICGGAGEEALAAVTAYAEAVGLMFQVVDDLLDVTQTTEHLGKGANKDEEQGKLTYPGLIGVEASRREVERLHHLSLEALAPLGPGADPLREVCGLLAVRTR